MAWTTPADLKGQLARLWERGELLRKAVTGNVRFPLRLACKGPGSADITDRFEAVRKWATELANTAPLRLEWREVRHRVQGLQRLPSSIWIDSLTDALAWLDRRREWDRFAAQVAMTRQVNPGLLPWLEKRPLQALELAADWPRLLAVVDWLSAHPRPGIHLRQVDVPSVHSKFIEAHRAVLADLLDLCLPLGSVDPAKTGVAQFAARYGFLEKPTRIRFRILDSAIQSVPGAACPDITLDADSFGRLTLDVNRVIITENETNFLALPKLPGSIAVFGAGYGWEALARAKWLGRCAIHYWGDIDTHGFAILDQLRGHFEHVTSFLMDRATLEAHRPLWGFEDKPFIADLRRLTPEELALYNDLRDNRIRERLRLEQEHIAFGWVRNRLDLLLR
ncbi:Wadjet anti-phage system protein JetD domain-containing protein [Azoarcus sp. DN11]|uniref:Wadjet anti-phage system protein JetD domain-containing protein n=1 Tax=Azoarcus sp. DN11 TaxID=356837 RepID=UPI000EADC589|nr:Wadjet anti-phage system protein JetD domain-containing protein [Azoarcus sp. DN11]AYH44302.1 hypothetical protein CDA09_13045 [Azoarcus sp. DN11]